MQLDEHWYRTKRTWLSTVLSPLSLIFSTVVAVRQRLYANQVKKTTHFPVPVIVVGNITVGGTGKTPFVIWLTQVLRELGYTPGIVTRGYGAKRRCAPKRVQENSDPEQVGDEAVLLQQRTQCPVVVGADRVKAVRLLLAETACDIVISDDGLQHYRLGRTLEIALIDGERRFGNGLLLPAGPLREPITRLRQVDFTLCLGDAEPREYAMRLIGDTVYALQDPTRQRKLSEFRGQAVHAVTAIANPERFFSTLASADLQLRKKTFRDHYLFQAADFIFADREAIFITEKDAVKCQSFADERFWVLPVTAVLPEAFKQALQDKLQPRKTP